MSNFVDIPSAQLLPDITEGIKKQFKTAADVMPEVTGEVTEVEWIATGLRVHFASKE